MRSLGTPRVEVGDEGIHLALEILKRNAEASVHFRNTSCDFSVPARFFIKPGANGGGGDILRRRAFAPREVGKPLGVVVR